jgi:hypothetical protein
MVQQFYCIINKKTVILTRQFRLPTYLNGNSTGMMLEVCADFRPRQSRAMHYSKKKKLATTNVTKVMETYMSLAQ